jgi:hypothetical protein
MTEAGREPHQHRADLKIISDEIPNTIRILDNGLAVDRYTCGMHALGLEESEEYAEVAGYGLGLVYAGREFFEWVVTGQHLHQAMAGKAAGGDLVMYFDQDRWTHVGRLITPDRAVSKWGVGLLYEHDLSEVPEQYGDEVQFFRNPGPDASMDPLRQLRENEGRSVRRVGSIKSNRKQLSCRHVVARALGTAAGPFGHAANRCSVSGSRQRDVPKSPGRRRWRRRAVNR